ncbi:MAG: class I SAM-dependent methyltransferase [Saprospiraceae bacterium]
MYQTEALELNIDGVFIKILQITNVDDLYEQLIAKGETHEDVQDERIPYWAELWPAAIGLSKYLIEFDIIKEVNNVIEIGCGLGLPGIVAGKLGANVIFTDYLAEALHFTKQNWTLNNAAESPSLGGDSGGQAQFEVMDWRQPKSELAADLVLASDICYEKRFFKYLPHAFRTLCKPGGSIVVSDPSREVAQDFFQNITREGFKVNKISYDIQPILGGRTVQVNVYHLTTR